MLPARAACRAAAHLLPTLSAERVAQELVKLLETPDPVAALRMMQEDGVLAVDPARGAPARPAAANDRDRAGTATRCAVSPR